LNPYSHFGGPLPEKLNSRAARSVSIIVPVLNEAALIRSFLRQLRAKASGAEIIVVDGGSTDDTIARCARLVDRVLSTSRGRARQMNAGAAVARGEVFWFLHADLLIPENALEVISSELSNDLLVGGCFRLRFPRREWVYRLSDSLGNTGVQMFGIALGDHGIFCRREAFLAAGGYRDLPLMEDAEIYRALRRLGRMRQLRPAILASPRRYEELGRWRTTIFYALILACYVAGSRVNTLTALYRRLIRGSNAAPTHSASVVRLGFAAWFSRSTTVPSDPRQ
jgi:rSAM/selenodomain-associated transferase 2